MNASDSPDERSEWHLTNMCSVCPISHCSAVGSVRKRSSRDTDDGPRSKPGRDNNNNCNRLDDRMLKNVHVCQDRDDKDEEEEDEKSRLDPISAESSQNPPQPYRRRKNFYHRWPNNSFEAKVSASQRGNGNGPEIEPKPSLWASTQTHFSSLLLVSFFRLNSLIIILEKNKTNDSRVLSNMFLSTI